MHCMALNFYKRVYVYMLGKLGWNGRKDKFLNYMAFLSIQIENNKKIISREC